MSDFAGGVMLCMAVLGAGMMIVLAAVELLIWWLT